jgi:hypothetical protein
MRPELGIRTAELGPDAEIVTDQRVNVTLTKIDPAVSQETYPLRTMPRTPVAHSLPTRSAVLLRGLSSRPQ